MFSQRRHPRSMQDRFIHIHIYTRAQREGEADRQTEKGGAHRDTNMETEDSRWLLFPTLAHVSLCHHLFMYPFCHDLQFERTCPPAWPNCLLFLFKDSVPWCGFLNAQSNPVLCPPRNFQLVPIPCHCFSCPANEEPSQPGRPRSACSGLLP